MRLDALYYTQALPISNRDSMHTAKMTGLRQLAFWVALGLAVFGVGIGLAGMVAAPAVRIVDLEGVKATLSMLPDPAASWRIQELVDPAAEAFFQVVDKPLRGVPGKTPVWFRLDIAVPSVLHG